VQRIRPSRAWIARLGRSATCTAPLSACCVLQDSTHPPASRRRAWIARWERTARQMAAAGVCRVRLGSQRLALAPILHRAAISRSCSMEHQRLWDPADLAVGGLTASRVTWQQ
jgi:hypothetical protein